jgi:nicotinamidase-related amidase
MNRALLIIDVQNDYFEHGKMELVNPIAAGENTRKLLDYFRSENLPIVHVQHIAPEGAPFFAEGTKGVEIHDLVKPLSEEKVVIKHYPNSFRDTDLLAYLKSKNITELVITGMMTHMCIDAGTRAATDLGFDCTVISDACATRDLEINGKLVKADDVHHAFLAALAFFYAKIQNTESYLTA